MRDVLHPAALLLEERLRRRASSSTAAARPRPPSAQCRRRSTVRRGGPALRGAAGAGPEDRLVLRPDRQPRSGCVRYLRPARACSTCAAMSAPGRSPRCNGGAAAARCVDSSADGARLRRSAMRSATASRVETLRADAFDALKALHERGERFDVVMLDPPAFIKRKKDIPQGQAAYRKLNQLALGAHRAATGCWCPARAPTTWRPRSCVSAIQARRAPCRALRADPGGRRPVAGPPGASGHPRNPLSEGVLLPRHARGRLNFAPHAQLSRLQSRSPFELGPVKVHWYGIMYLLGFAAAWWLGAPPRRAARLDLEGRATSTISSSSPCSASSSAAASATCCSTACSFWAKDPWYPFKIWDGGMSFHGGLLGVIVALTLFAWRRGRNVADVYDFTAPLPALGLFFGRLGNFINGELWGKPTTVPWGFNVNGAGAPSLAALRGAASKGWCCSPSCGGSPPSRGRGWRPPGLFLLIYGIVALPRRVRARAGRADRLSRRRLAHHGPGAVAAHDPRRRAPSSPMPTRARALGQLRHRSERAQ